MKETLRSYLKRRVSLRLASRKIFAWFPASSAFVFPQAVCLASCMLFLRLPESYLLSFLCALRSASRNFFCLALRTLFVRLLASALLSFAYALRSASRKFNVQLWVRALFDFPQVICLALGTLFVRLPANSTLGFAEALRLVSHKPFAWLCGSSLLCFTTALGASLYFGLLCRCAPDYM